MYGFIKKSKTIIVTVLVSLFCAVSICTVLFYIMGPAAAYYHSDSFDTLYWAGASVDGKTLMNKDFTYAAILPFGGTTIMMPLIAVFGFSMKAQQYGMAVFALLMFYSVYFLVRSMKKSIVSALLTTGVFALTLCCSSKVREIFYDHVIYYSMSGFLSCMLLGLYLRFEESFWGTNKKGVFISLLFTAFFGFGAGLDSSQMIVSGVMPVFFAIFFETFFDKTDKIISKDNFPKLCFCCTCALAAVAGLLLIKFTDCIISSYADSFSCYSAEKKWLENLLIFPWHWVSLFGIEKTNMVSMFSSTSLKILIRLFACTIFAITPVIALFYRKFLDRNLRMALFLHLGISLVVLFGYVFGRLSVANWRLCPIMYTGIICTVMVLLSLKKYIVPQRLGIICLGLVIVFDGFCFQKILKMKHKSIKDNENYKKARVLEENHLEYGYASFWTSQAITVLSDSKVKCAGVFIRPIGVTPHHYQSNKNWYKENKATERYFLLASNKELSALAISDDWKDISEKCIDKIYGNGYTILIFESNFFVKQ